MHRKRVWYRVEAIDLAIPSQWHVKKRKWWWTSAGDMYQRCKSGGSVTAPMEEGSRQLATARVAIAPSVGVGGQNLYENLILLLRAQGPTATKR